MRKLNEMFHIDGERLVKTSNGQAVPEDEPVFILRGRDVLACWTLGKYIDACRFNDVPEDRIESLRELKKKFFRYGMDHNTKIPGATHGR